MKYLLGAGVVTAVLAVCAVPAWGQTKPGSEAYEKIAKAYLEGSPEELEGLVAKLPRDGSGLSATEKAELSYLWAAAQEGRPAAWWKACKAGKLSFKPGVWGRTVTATFDPAAKNGVQTQTTNGVMTMTVSWTQGDMDNTAEAEHGFTKGELNQLAVWQTLGMADTWTTLPFDALLNLNDAQKVKLSTYLDFRGNVTAEYYALPKARRWALWLACAGYMDAFSKVPTVMSRKALAAMFVAEMVGRKDKYPSVTLPATFPSEKPEETLALHLKGWVEKHSLTVPEDRLLREAIRAFAAGNEKGVRENGRVTLPNGLWVALDPAQDAGNHAKREAWLKGMWERNAKKP